jgi:hypothetical protein
MRPASSRTGVVRTIDQRVTPSGSIADVAEARPGRAARAGGDVVERPA